MFAFALHQILLRSRVQSAHFTAPSYPPRVDSFTLCIAALPMAGCSLA